MFSAVCRHWNRFGNSRRLIFFVQFTLEGRRGHEVNCVLNTTCDLVCNLNHDSQSKADAKVCLSRILQGFSGGARKPRFEEFTLERTSGK